jgi:adenosyl cobinamide kinase/adenosyl cobinamide phosphate guanylyltransferase
MREERAEHGRLRRKNWRTLETNNDIDSFTKKKRCALRGTDVTV